MSDSTRRRPAGEGILNLEGLADRWGKDDLEELKRFVRSEGVPYFYLGRRNPGKVRWDDARFRIEDIKRWEGESLIVYNERKGEAAVAEQPKSILRGRGRRRGAAG